MGAAELDAIIGQRHALGHDRFDEVWEGEYRVVPGPAFRHARVDSDLQAALRPLARAVGLTCAAQFNLGAPHDYRVPDQGYVRGTPRGTHIPTAEIVVEVLSPGDRTYDKFGFFAAHQVREIVIADPETATVEIHLLGDHGLDYTRTDVSAVLGVDAAALAAAIDWP